MVGRDVPGWFLTGRTVWFFQQGFEGTLLWETLDSGGLCTAEPSSVLLSDGGGVLKMSSVRTQQSGASRVQECDTALSLNCRSQRGRCLIGALWDSLAWPEASRSPSMVGPESSPVWPEALSSQYKGAPSASGHTGRF